MILIHENVHERGAYRWFLFSDQVGVAGSDELRLMARTIGLDIQALRDPLGEGERYELDAKMVSRARRAGAGTAATGAWAAVKRKKYQLLTARREG